MQNPASIPGLTGRGLQVGDGPGQTPTEVAETRLDEAWRALRREMRRLGVDIIADIASGELESADVADVVCQAAMRVLRNPAGVTDESGAVDDYTESRKFGDATQDLYFTAAELRRLTPVAVAGAPAAGSVPYS